MDMRAGNETTLAGVVVASGAAHPHTAYLFGNKPGTRLKVLVHDGMGIWLAYAGDTKAASIGSHQAARCSNVFNATNSMRLR